MNTVAGAACKVIINNGLRAVSESLETVLMSPLVRGPMISEEKCGDYIQRLADIDIAAYSGKDLPHGGLAGIMLDLEAEGVFTAEIWQVFHKPRAHAPLA